VEGLYQAVAGTELDFCTEHLIELHDFSPLTGSDSSADPMRIAMKGRTTRSCSVMHFNI
jgi:hypothetical protein